MRVDLQRVARDGRRGGVVGVRQGADGDALAVDTAGVHLVGALERDALAGRSTHPGLRLERLHQGAGVAQRGQLAGSGERDEPLERALFSSTAWTFIPRASACLR